MHTYNILLGMSSVCLLGIVKPGSDLAKEEQQIHTELKGNTFYACNVSSSYLGRMVVFHVQFLRLNSPIDLMDASYSRLKYLSFEFNCETAEARLPD